MKHIQCATRQRPALAQSPLGDFAKSILNAFLFGGNALFFDLISDLIKAGDDA